MYTLELEAYYSSVKHFEQQLMYLVKLELVFPYKNYTPTGINSATIFKFSP